MGCPPVCCLQVCVMTPSGCSCTLLASLPKTCLSWQQASDAFSPINSLQPGLPGCLPNKGSSRWIREENNRETPEALLGGQELPRTQWRGCGLQDWSKTRFEHCIPLTSPKHSRVTTVPWRTRVQEQGTGEHMQGAFLPPLPLPWPGRTKAEGKYTGPGTSLLSCLV